MATDEVRKQAQRETLARLEKAINEGESQTGDEIHPPEGCTAEDLTIGVPLPTTEEYVEFGNQWIGAIDDYRFDVTEFISDGSKGMMEFAWSGKIKAKDGSRHPFSIRGVSICEFDDNNLLTKETAYFDLPEMLRQLGLPHPSMESVLELVGLEEYAKYYQPAQ